jgi:hypothetical protein
MLGLGGSTQHLHQRRVSLTAQRIYMHKPRKKVVVSCDFCGKDTLKTDSTVYVARKHGNKMFCSSICEKSYKYPKIDCTCKTCGVEFVRTKSNIGASGNTFCSKSCATKYNNRYFPKRKKTYENEKHCSLCGKPKKNISNFCQACARELKTEETLNFTLGYIRSLYHEKSSLDIAGKLRGYSRQAYKRSNYPKQCANCGYSKHYEVCHIKPIKDFDDSATMGEIHNINNLIALCRNCHWELDHGMLRIEDIPR